MLQAVLDAFILSAGASLLFHWPHFQDSGASFMWLMRQIVHDVAVAIGFVFVLDLFAIWLAPRLGVAQVFPAFTSVAAPLLAGFLFATVASLLPILSAIKGYAGSAWRRDVTLTFVFVFISVFFLEMLVRLVTAQMIAPARDDSP